MQLQVTSSTITIVPSGLEKLWSFTIDPIVIEREHLQSISLEEPALDWKSIRAPGTSLPGVFHAGTFHTPLGKEFWYFRVSKPKITLFFSGATYQRIILSPDDIEHWYQQLQACLPSME